MSKQATCIVLAAALVWAAGAEGVSARGFGGFHGGIGGGGLGGGLAGGLGGGGLGGGIHAGGLGGGGLGGGLGGDLGARLGGGLGGDLGNRLGGAGGGIGADLGDRLGGAGGLGGDLGNRLGGGGLGQGGLGQGGLGQGIGDHVSRSQLSNFLGLPADNGLHNLSGETQSKASQLADQVRAGDQPFKNLSGETQSRASQLYDQFRDGDRPFQNNLSGETQSRASQLYDNIRDGNGPFKNFIPGETQKPGSRLYDDIRAGNHPFRPYSPWVIHNNGVVIRRNFNNYFIFTPNWYRRYPGAWYPAAWAYGDAWAVATWDSLAEWLAYSAVQPVYYDYGNSIVYQDNSVYVNNQNVGTQAEYYQQAQTLASDGGEADTEDKSKWLSLGVFAFSDGSQTSSNMILELAVNKEGIIRGNYTNTDAGQSSVIQGSVDKQTQRAAWTIGDNDSTVMETGIYNLTKDEAPVLVHYGADKTVQRLLVRLDKKDDGGDSDSSGN